MSAIRLRVDDEAFSNKTDILAVRGRFSLMVVQPTTQRKLTTQANDAVELYVS